MINLPKKLTASLSLFGLLAVVAALQLSAQATHLSNGWAQSTAYSYNGDSLRDCLVRLRSSVHLYKGSADIDQPVTFSARVYAVSHSGVRRLCIRNFQFLSDGPRSTGEFNLGAGSRPSWVGVLGSAVTEEHLLQD